MVLFNIEWMRNVNLDCNEADDGVQLLERLEAVRPFHRRFDLAVQALNDSNRVSRLTRDNAILILNKCL
jgi:hypothetical protein